MLKNRDGFWPAFMFRRMTLDGLAAWKHLATGEWRHFLAVGRAHGAFYLRLFSILRSRRILRRSSTRNPNEIGWWNQSVVVAYFIRGNARARDLELPGLE